MARFFMERMMEMAVKFGVMADLHVDIMPDCEQRVAAFLEACRKEDVDFVVQLGDFCYPDIKNCACAPEYRPVNIQNALDYPVYANKEKIMEMWNNFEKPAYHVLGNHDCDFCTKKQIFEYYGVDYGSYYSFDMGGFHFVVLDGNYMKVNGEYIAYEQSNYFEQNAKTPGILPYISGEQLDWLEKDLANAKYPAVLFSHQRLCGLGAVKNAPELRKIFRNAPHGVILSANGHMHQDIAYQMDDVWYLDINSISNYWFGEEYTCLGRYGEAADEKYPNVRYVAPYTEAVFGIITIDDEKITVKGRSAEYVGKTPDEIGATVGEGPFTIHAIYPRVSDRILPFKCKTIHD